MICFAGLVGLAAAQVEKTAAKKADALAGIEIGKKTLIEVKSDQKLRLTPAVGDSIGPGGPPHIEGVRSRNLVCADWHTRANRREVRKKRRIIRCEITEDGVPVDPCLAGFTLDYRIRDGRVRLGVDRDGKVSADEMGRLRAEAGSVGLLYPMPEKLKEGSIVKMAVRPLACLMMGLEFSGTDAKTDFVVEHISEDRSLARLKGTHRERGPSQFRDNQLLAWSNKVIQGPLQLVVNTQKGRVVTATWQGKVEGRALFEGFLCKLSGEFSSRLDCRHDAAAQQACEGPALFRNVMRIPVQPPALLPSHYVTDLEDPPAWRFVSYLDGQLMTREINLRVHGVEDAQGPDTLEERLGDIIEQGVKKRLEESKGIKTEVADVKSPGGIGKSIATNKGGSFHEVLFLNVKPVVLEVELKCPSSKRWKARKDLAVLLESLGASR